MRHVKVVAIIILTFLGFALAGVALRVRTPSSGPGQIDVSTAQTNGELPSMGEARPEQLRAFSELSLPLRRVAISDEQFSLAVARTNASRSAGLSGVVSMQYTDGMLFEFENPGTHGFWMRGMQFPLDILWLDSAGEIVHIEEQLSPDTYPQTFYPAKAAQYVIEVNAGVVNDLGLSVGQVIPVGSVDFAEPAGEPDTE